jgi:hypothetical protein
MRIRTDGNVGIGTNNPNGPLEVQNQSSATVVENLWLTAPNLTAGQQSRFFWGKNTGIYNGGFFYYSHVGDGSTSNYFRLDFNGKDNVLCAAASGNVGIGTTNPSAGGVNSLGGAALDVYKTGTGVSSNVNISAGCDGSASSANKASLIFNIKGAGGGVVNGGITHQLLGSNYGFNFQPQTIGTSVMVVNGNGNVGIGTNNPANALQVAGTAATISVGGTAGWSNVVQLGNVSYSQYGSVSAYPANRFTILTSGLPGVNDMANANGGLYVASQGLRLTGQRLVWGGNTSYESAIEIDGGRSPLAAASHGQIRFYTANAQRVVIDESGNVGIGTTSPGYLLDVSNSTSSTSTSFLGLTNPFVFGFNTGLNIGSSIVYSSRWQGDGSSGVVEMCKIDGRKEQNSNFGDSYLAFQTRYVTDRVNGGAGTLTEKMRITGAGLVGIGIQTPSRHFTIVDGGSSPMLIDQTSSSIGDVTILIRKASTTNFTGDNFLNFQTNATYDANGNYVSGAVQRFIVRADGYIASGSLGGGATTLSVDASGGIIRTPSDARLKSNITTITYGLDIANAIRPVFYTWNEPERLGAGRQIGMIAQEVAVLVPEAVSAGLDEDGTLSLDYQKLVPVLTKAIQELSAENTALKSRLDSLEARLAAAGL